MKWHEDQLVFCGKDTAGRWILQIHSGIIIRQYELIETNGDYEGEEKDTYPSSAARIELAGAKIRILSLMTAVVNGRSLIRYGEVRSTSLMADASGPNTASCSRRISATIAGC